MATDLERTVHERGISLSVPYGEDLLYEGFITDLARGPQSKAIVCLRSDEAQRAVMFHGIPPRYLEVNDHLVPVYLSHGVASHPAVLVSGFVGKF